MEFPIRIRGFANDIRGNGPRTKAQWAAGQGPEEPAAPWDRVLGPGPIPIIAEHQCINSNQ